MRAKNDASNPFSNQITPDMRAFQRKRLGKALVKWFFFTLAVLFVWLTMFSPAGRYRELWDWYITLPFFLFLAAVGLYLLGVLSHPTLYGRVRAVKPSVVSTTKGMSRQLKDVFFLKITLESGEKIRLELDSDSFDGIKDHFKPGDMILWLSYLPFPMVLDGCDRRYQLCPMCGSLTLYTGDEDFVKGHRSIDCDCCGKEFVCPTRPPEHDIGNFPNERPKLGRLKPN